MADLRVKSTGKEFRRVDNATALVLEELFPGDLERINAPARASFHPAQHKAVNEKPSFAQTPTWGVSRFINPKDDSESFAITLAAGAATYTYPGTPEGAQAHFGRIGRDFTTRTGGFTVPEHILVRYRQLYVNKGPLNPVDPRLGKWVAVHEKTKSDLEFANQQLAEAAFESKNTSTPVSTGTFGVVEEELPAFPKRDGEGKYL